MNTSQVRYPCPVCARAKHPRHRRGAHTVLLVPRQAQVMKAAAAARQAQLDEIKKVDRTIIEEVRRWPPTLHTAGAIQPPTRGRVYAQIRQQSQREVSKLRIQLRRQQAAAQESAEEATRLKQLLGEQCEQGRATLARLRTAEQQVRSLRVGNCVAWVRDARRCRWRAESGRSSSCRQC